MVENRQLIQIVQIEGKRQRQEGRGREGKRGEGRGEGEWEGREGREETSLR